MNRIYLCIILLFFIFINPTLSLTFEKNTIQDSYVKIVPDILYAKFSPNRNYVITVHIGNTIRVWDIYSGEQIQSIRFYGNEIIDFTILNNQEIVLGYQDGTICIFDLNNGDVVNKYNKGDIWDKGGDGDYFPIRFSNSGKSVIVRHFDYSIYEVKSGREIFTANHEYPYPRLTILNDNYFLIKYSSYNALEVIDINTGKLFKKEIINLNPFGFRDATLSSKNGILGFIYIKEQTNKFDQNEGTLCLEFVNITNNEQLFYKEKKLGTTTKSIMWVLKLHILPHVSISNSGEYAAVTGFDDDKVRMIILDTGVEYTLPLIDYIHDEYSILDPTIMFNNNHNSIFVHNSHNGTIWDISGIEPAKACTIKGSLDSLIYLSHNFIFASTIENGFIKFWDIINNREIYHVKQEIGNKNNLLLLDKALDSLILFSDIRHKDKLKRVFIWEVPSGKEIFRFETYDLYEKGTPPSFSVSITSPPKINNINANNLETFVNDTLFFTPQISGRIPIKYKWDFGDGSYCYNKLSTHRFKKPGIYDVKLIVENNGGRDTSKIEIKINSDVKREIFAHRKESTSDILNISKLAQDKYYSLLIAIQSYQDKNISKLSHPISDANRFKNILINSYNFNAKNIIFLKNPNRSQIIQELDAFSKYIKQEDNVLIFYSGHGYWDKDIEQGYWLPHDSKASNKSAWISNGTIRDYIKGIKSKHTLLISDACFSGGIFKTRSIYNPSIAVKQLYNLNSRRAITSGTLTEVPDKSVFATYLFKRLEQNQHKYLSAGQLFIEIRDLVINNSPFAQTPQYGVIQSAGDEGGDFIFIKGN